MRNKFLQNRSQTSLFIIIAVIIVLIIILLVYLSNKNDFRTNPFEDQSSAKVRDYVQTCLEMQTKDAVFKLGEHGGWLYHLPMSFTDRDNPEYVNQRAQGLSFLEKTEMPYWYYYDDSSETFRTNIPPYDTQSTYSLKNQIRRYIEDTLDKDCIKGFKAFEDVYTIKYKKEDMVVTVDFIRNDIDVELHLPIEITEGNSDNHEYLDTFDASMENHLKIPYFLARDIVTAQKNSAFLEYRMLEFLTPYQDTKSRDLLPPFYDLTLDYDFKPWFVDDIEKLVMRIFQTHISSIQFLNTDYEEPYIPEGLENNEFYRGVSGMYLKDYLSENSLVKQSNPGIFDDFSNYKVTPSIEPIFPVFFSLAPSMGDVILLPKPEAFIGLVFLSMTEYIAVYEITAPVLFKIVPDNPTDDFIFNLAVEANIDHNMPKQENFELSDKFAELNGVEDSSTLICDPPQFISDYITLNITDPVNHGNLLPEQSFTGVEDAVMTFDCKGLATCFVGMTEINGRYTQKNHTLLKFRLPVNCDPGTLEIYKYGHKKLIFENIDPSIDKPIDLGEVMMPSQAKFNVTLNLINSGESKFAVGERLGEYDTAFIIMQHLEDPDIVQVIDIYENNQDSLSISLMPGNYSIQAFLLYNKTIIIPSEEYEFKTGFFSSESVTLPQMNLSVWTKGGLQLDKFEITLKDIYSATLNENEFHINIIDFGLPSTYGDLESLSNVMENLKTHSMNKEPYFD